MRRTNMRAPKYLLSALCVLAVIPTRADIKTTHETSTGGKLFSKTTRYVRAEGERTETTFSFGGVEQKTVTLMLCDKKQMLTLNPDLKMYTVTPLVEPAKPGARKAEAQAAGEKKTGTMTMELVGIKELGEETIGEYKTRCYEVTTRMKTTGCVGDSTNTTTQRICLGEGDADGAGGGCGLTSAPSGGDGANPCQTSIEQIGDWSRYNKLMQGLQVRTRIMKPGSDEAQMETKLTMVSRAKLGDEWFTVPQDYKQVTQKELQEAQTKAMMEKMMAGAK